MANAIERFYRSSTALVRAAVGNCTEIDFHNVMAGGFYSSVSATFTFHCAPITAGTYNPLQTDAEPPVAITRTIETGKYYLFPQECYGAGAVKIVSSSDGTVNYCVKG